MEIDTLIIAAFCLVSWGTGAFVAKLATNKIGERAVFWDLIGLMVIMLLYCLVTFKVDTLMNIDRRGIFLALLAGAIGSIGGVTFYMLVSKKDASSAVPLTALYPVLTAILAFIFLKESLSVSKVVGIILSGIALYLLSF